MITLAGSGPVQPPVVITTAVAAAAVVPFSSTSMFAWWMTSEMKRRSATPVGTWISVKSAAAPNASGIPSDVRTSPSWACVSMLKRGMRTLTEYG